jgi:hypothetical protein
MKVALDVAEVAAVNLGVERHSFLAQASILSRLPQLRT